MRIVSFVPSATEIVCALGLEDALVGVTHECDHPPEVVGRVARLTRGALDPHAMTEAEIDHRVAKAASEGEKTSLVTVDEAALRRAAPTHVLVQRTCAVCGVDEPVVRETCARVLGEQPAFLDVSPTTIEEMIAAVATVGDALGVHHRAEKVAARLSSEIDRVRRAVPAGVHRPRVVFLEWIDPPFSAGHWVPGMIAIAGGHDVLGEVGEPSARETAEQLAAVAPEVVIAGPCGLGVERAAADVAKLRGQPWWDALPAVRDGRVYAVDANGLFSRGGPRLVQGLAVLAKILHDVDTGLVPPASWRKVN